MAPRYTYATTETASPPDTDKSWRLAHVLVTRAETGQARDGTDTTWNYHEYVWEWDSFGEYIPRAAPRLGPETDTP